MTRWAILGVVVSTMACTAQKARRSVAPGTAHVAATAAAPQAAAPVAALPAEEYNEAVALYEQGKQAGHVDFARVEAGLKQVLEQEPAFAKAQFNLGVVYQDQGRVKEARDTYNKTLRLDPTYMDALANSGRLYMDEGDRQLAIVAFQKAVEVDPFNATARNNLAYVYRHNAVKAKTAGAKDEANKLFAKAVGNVRKVLAKAPENIAAYNNLALIYYELGKYEVAQLVCLNALKFKKPDAGLHNNLGQVLLKMNKVTDALAQFHQSLKVDADHVPAHLNIGSITLSYRDYATAFEHLDRAATLEPRNVEAALARAVALRGLKRYDEAKAGYTRVLELNEHNARAFFNLGVLHQQYLNDSKQAIEDYGRFLQYAAASEKRLRKDVKKRIGNLQIMLKYEAEAAAEARDAPKEAEAEGEGDAEGAAPEGAAPEGAAPEGAAPAGGEAAPAAEPAPPPEGDKPKVAP